MKAREVQRLYKSYIQPVFPEFFIHGHLLYLKPVDYLLRGICFESSGFDKNRFNIYVFIQPTFILRDYLWFSFGDRLHYMIKGIDHWWTIDDQNEKEIMTTVVSLLSQAKSSYLDQIIEPGDLVKRLPKMVDINNSIVGQQTIAFTHILSGEKEKALVALDLLSKTLDDYYLENTQRILVKDWSQQVDDIRNRLLESNEKVIELLELWRRETMKSLHLEKEIEKG